MNCTNNYESESPANITPTTSSSTGGSVDNANRIIYLYGEITTESIQSAVASLMTMLNADKTGNDTRKDYTVKPIHIHIETHGGALYAAWSLVNIMISSKTPIYTYTSHADSAGSIIFIAGHKRFVGEYTNMIIHQPRVWAGYSLVKEVEESSGHGKKIWKQVRDFYISRTKLSEKTLDEIFEKKLDFLVDSKKALKFKIATDKYPQFG